MSQHRPLVVAALLAVAGCVCGALLWRRAPAKVTEHTTATATTATTEATATQVREVTHAAPVVREVERLDPHTGAVVERERETTGAVDTTRTTAATSEVEARTETRTETVRVVKAAPPPWLSLALAAPLGSWSPASGLHLAPALAIELDVRPFTLPLLDRLHLVATYSPPLLNPQHRHEVTAEARLVLLEW